MAKRAFSRCYAGFARVFRRLSVEYPLRTQLFAFRFWAVMPSDKHAAAVSLLGFIRLSFKKKAELLSLGLYSLSHAFPGISMKRLAAVFGSIWRLLHKWYRPVIILYHYDIEFSEAYFCPCFLLIKDFCDSLYPSALYMRTRRETWKLRRDFIATVYFALLRDADNKVSFHIPPADLCWALCQAASLPLRASCLSGAYILYFLSL